MIAQPWNPREIDTVAPAVPGPVSTTAKEWVINWCKPVFALVYRFFPVPSFLPRDKSEVAQSVRYLAGAPANARQILA